MEKKQYMQPRTEAFKMQVESLMDVAVSNGEINTNPGGFEEGAKEEDGQIGFHDLWED